MRANQFYFPDKLVNWPLTTFNYIVLAQKKGAELEIKW